MTIKLEHNNKTPEFETATKKLFEYSIFVDLEMPGSTQVLDLV